MKKLALFLIISSPSLAFCSSDNDTNVLKAVHSIDVNAVLSSLRKWEPTQEEAQAVVSEIYLLQNRKVSTTFRSDVNKALAQIIVSAPLLYISTKNIVNAFSDTPNDLSFWNYCTKFYKGELHHHVPMFQTIKPNLPLHIASGVIATLSAAGLVCGLSKLGFFGKLGCSHNNSEFTRILAIKALVYDALRSKNMLEKAIKQSDQDRHEKGVALFNAASADSSAH